MHLIRLLHKGGVDGARGHAPSIGPALRLACVALLLVAAVPSAVHAEAAMNPLLQEWTGPYGGVPPWDRVRPELFPEALQQGIDELLREIDAIASNPAPATFENTFVPMEDAGRTLNRVAVLFSVMTNNMNSPEYQALDVEWSPKLAEAEDAVYFNTRLFERIKAVHGKLESANLTPEEKRLVDRTYRQFVRRGARLDAARKERLGSINQELARLFAEFSNRVLADEDTWVLIENEADLSGLPAPLRGSYRTAAGERGLDGWAVVNTRSSVEPFLTFADNRALRERVWRAFTSRGDSVNDTKPIIAKIIALRAERAKLLGYPSHAHWRMEDTMARDPAAAERLMRRVWKPAVARVREEVRDMQAVARREGADIGIQPWDYLYYAEKVRRERYDLDLNEVKPYFQLDNMLKAAFWTAERLYGLTFDEITGKVPVFHPDVRVFEVREGDRHVGLFYFDSYARPGKRSGAWASTYRTHENFTGREVSPLTSNNNNFVKGEAGKPVLISLDDARTLFHEFGHALHALLSEVKYPSLARTPRDYVEYPSQVMEHWVLTRPVLDRFARHYETGESMPQALVDRIEASEKFNQGYQTVSYLSAALVDMALHTRRDGNIDVSAFERDTLASLGMPREIVMRHRLPHFLHLFSSDSYSAGYYSYLWSEVMDADTWQAFKEAGDVFDRETAKRMRRYILAPGNSTDRAEAYRQFRGRDPDVKALLIERGFPADAAP